MIFHDIKFGSKMLRGNALQAATTVTRPQSAGGFDPRNICCFEVTGWFTLIGGWQGGCHKKIFSHVSRYHYSSIVISVSRMREVSLLTELGQRSHLVLANVYSGGELT